LEGTIHLSIEPAIGDHVTKTVDIRTDCGYVLQYHDDPEVVQRDFDYIVGLQSSLFEVAGQQPPAADLDNDSLPPMSSSSTADSMADITSVLDSDENQSMDGYYEESSKAYSGALSRDSEAEARGLVGSKSNSLNTLRSLLVRFMMVSAVSYGLSNLLVVIVPLLVDLFM
jgi:hypothetical protein